MPDDALSTAAQRGELGTDAGVLQHATRLLMIRRGSRKPPLLSRSLPAPLRAGQPAAQPQRLPWLLVGPRSFAPRGDHRYLEHIIFDQNGTWSTVLTAPYTFVNARLATFYGLPAPSSPDADGWGRVDLDPATHAGLLTQASILTATTPAALTNPVLRGKFVRTEFCAAACRLRRLHCKLPSCRRRQIQTLPPENDSLSIAPIRAATAAIR